ncbi:heavy metal translocating P-type ATPase [Anaerosoma tenue]|uniref:heavy metal translocating P-type ATPase n=1 Tax=Anaerosoma tenue TaxID=2933588 RepID=UPI002260F0E6|nr:heavy metal translocating P-type ATPase [Anaerosoma tenue]MCK8115067.1 heavy metal translocating P-type ATPase [Anaerosoma tenue]
MTTHEHHTGSGSPSAHDRHEGHSAAMFRDKFWLSFVLSVPAIVWSEMVQDLLGYTAPEFPGSAYIPAVFGTIVFVYGGLPFLKGARNELADRLPGMMTLISLAITVAFGYSLAVTLGAPGMDLWWELATLVTIMLLGHWIEMRSISQASGALAELASLLPDEAERIGADGSAEHVVVSALATGDLVLVRPGARIPADGEVAEGESSVDESMITGESRHVDKAPGDAVIAGTVNGAGSLRVRVTHTGEETALAGIMRLVAGAQASRSRVQDLADRAARLLTFVAIGSATLTAIGWWIAGAEWSYIVERVVTVLVIACPHALGLAIPLVVAISTTLGARNGLLVRERRGLETARLLDLVVFDKTGTLTLAEHRVVRSAALSGFDADEATALAGSAESDSEHPIARALAAAAEEAGQAVPAASGFESLPGQGVRAHVDGRDVAVGGPALLEALGLAVPAGLEGAAGEARDAGLTATYLVVDGTVTAVFAVGDAVRPESAEAVKRLHAMGIESAVLTGDAQQVANAVAAELGIERVLAEVLPADKARTIEDLQAEGRRVAMVGDGVNDAAALATADVGIAIGAGTEVAIEAGDIVLVRSDPRDVASIVSLSRATYRKMVQNLWWAAGYNIIAIPLAAGVLAWAGITLSPAVGAVLMSASTVIVAANAQLLRRWRPEA